MKKTFLSIFFLLVICVGMAQVTTISPTRNRLVSNKVSLKAETFDLKDVQLLESPFYHAQELNHQLILNIKLDSLLYAFRRVANIPTAKKYNGNYGWPVTGHTLGHFLTASALLYRNTSDIKVKMKADSVVAELAVCQDKIGNGYIGGFPENSILHLEGWINEPKFKADVPWYCLHKVYVGLLDMYLLTDNQQALSILKKVGVWIIKNTDQLSEAKMQQMLETEHGGMNEFLADLYTVTGDEKYLKLSFWFNHRAVIDPLSKGEDPLNGLHANTQIPKLIGLTRQYELTGDKMLDSIAQRFWNVVVAERSYVTGGNSSKEHFTPKDKLSEAFENTTETCNEYNMLKLTDHLFSLNPKACYSDYFERTLFNQILSSRNPKTGEQLYFQQLKAESSKKGWKNNPIVGGKTCCHGTGLESNSKFEESIYFHNGNNELFVNQFVASELNWDTLGFKLRQETSYPASGAIKLGFNCKKPLSMKINIRCPWWIGSDFQLILNCKKLKVKTNAGSYAQIDRIWQNGDILEVKMPMKFRMEGFKDNPKRAAIMYGPLVMVAVVEQ
jgi:DUF1680 family protein